MSNEYKDWLKDENEKLKQQLQIAKAFIERNYVVFDNLVYECKETFEKIKELEK